jgi:hypothetical protein
MTMEELDTLKSTNDGKLTKRQHFGIGGDDVDNADNLEESEPKRRKMSKTREIHVAQIFQPASDLTLIKATSSSLKER